MKKAVAIFALMFSYVLVDLNSTKLRSKNNTLKIIITDEDRKNKLKRKRRKYKNKKYQKRARFRQKKYKFKGSVPKDKRFSNQRALRRMYRND